MNDIHSQVQLNKTQVNSIQPCKSLERSFLMV